MSTNRMKHFTIIRVKTSGISIHDVWVKSKQQAQKLYWADDFSEVMRFITRG